MPNGQIIGA
ncbi:unnamed protein product, partial [Rotaria sp. Silwood1]